MPKPDTSATPQGHQRQIPGGYEKRDASPGWIFGVVGFLLVSGLAMHFGLAGMMKVLEKTPTPADEWAGARRVPETGSTPKFPRLQISPAEDLKAFRTRENAELDSYGWINKTAGVVRIPIARAMDLLAQRGLPVRSGTNGGALGPSSLELQQHRPEDVQPENQGESK